MTIYYALGGGWGHLSRAFKILSQMQTSNFRIIVSDAMEQSIFKEENLIRIPLQLSKEKRSLQERLATILNNSNVDEIYIDSFPVGIIGELNPIKIHPKIKIYYICRYLNWESYRLKIINSIVFDTTFIVDEISDNHRHFVESNSKTTQKLLIKNIPLNTSTEELKQMFDLPSKKVIWLIVHSSNQEELETIIDYAEECNQIENKQAFFLIISNKTPKPRTLDYKIINYYPASDFFPLAGTIYTGCGFNIMTETHEFMHKHRFIPFERKYDNQFLRAIKRRTEQGKKKNYS